VTSHLSMWTVMTMASSAGHKRRRLILVLCGIIGDIFKLKHGGRQMLGVKVQRP
jgi:hypothetical protein